MNAITITTVMSEENFQEVLSSKRLFTFVMLLDLILTVWCVVLMDASENMATLQSDLIIPLIFVFFGALFILLREFIHLGLYLYNLFTHKIKLCHVYEYNYRCIGAVCLGWVILDVVHPMMTDYFWSFNLLQIFFGLCALLLIIRVCLSLYLDGFYNDKLKYDNINDFYYEDEKIS